MSQSFPAGPTFSTTEPVDVVVIGSGPGGGSMARELARRGIRVIVLEQGKAFSPGELEHDEFGSNQNRWTTSQPQTYRKTKDEVAGKRIGSVYARAVGGGSFHYTGNYWRFRPVDFRELSTTGPVAGADLADWPISYDDLEPYYTAVEWAIGVSGEVSRNRGEPPRSRPYPLPPLNVTPAGVLLDVGCRKLGWSSKAAPMAILSQPYQGRQPCHNCGFCSGYPCEWGAKSGTNYTMIPEALATGRCELRSECYVRKIETDQRGRVTGVIYFDRERREIFQRARVVVLSANGAETPRLLLLSKSGLFPDGLANGSGLVGKHLMHNGEALNWGEFEHEINAHRGPVVTRITHEHYELDRSRGLVGGGGIDFRVDGPPIGRALAMPPDEPTWGSAFKKRLTTLMPRVLVCFGHTTSLPVETNSITLDPELEDDWGIPAIRTTFREHPEDVRTMTHFLGLGKQLLEAAGARKTWSAPIADQPGALFHLLGTCRMGNDPRRSVVDKFHRAHEVPNLFIVDGSSLVTGGRGQPTLTIQALAFRAADHLAGMFSRREI